MFATNLFTHYPMLAKLYLFLFTLTLVSAKPISFLIGFTTQNVVNDLQSGLIDRFLETGANIIKVKYQWGPLQPLLKTQLQQEELQALISSVKNITLRPSKPLVVLQMSANNSVLANPRVWYNYGLFQSPADREAYVDFMKRLIYTFQEDSSVIIGFSESPQIADYDECMDAPRWAVAVRSIIDSAPSNISLWIPPANLGKASGWNSNLCNIGTIGSIMQAGVGRFKGSWAFTLDLDDERFMTSTSPCNSGIVTNMLQGITSNLRTSNETAVIVNLGGGLQTNICRDSTNEIVNYIASNEDVWRGIILSQKWKLPSQVKSAEDSTISAEFLSFLNSSDSRIIISPTSIPGIPSYSTGSVFVPTPTIPLITHSPTLTTSIISPPLLSPVLSPLNTRYPLPSILPNSYTIAPTQTALLFSSSRPIATSTNRPNEQLNTPPPVMPNFLEGSNNTNRVGVGIIIGTVLPCFFVFAALLHYFVYKFRASSPRRLAEPILRGI